MYNALINMDGCLLIDLVFKFEAIVFWVSLFESKLFLVSVCVLINMVVHIYNLCAETGIKIFFFLKKMYSARSWPLWSHASFHISFLSFVRKKWSLMSFLHSWVVSSVADLLSCIALAFLLSSSIATGFGPTCFCMRCPSSNFNKSNYNTCCKQFYPLFFTCDTPLGSIWSRRYIAPVKNKT